MEEIPFIHDIFSFLKIWQIFLPPLRQLLQVTFGKRENIFDAVFVGLKHCLGNDYRHFNGQYMNFIIEVEIKIAIEGLQNTKQQQINKQQFEKDR